MIRQSSIRTLGEAGERGFLKRFLPSLSKLTPSKFLVPPGDDAAVLKKAPRAVLSIDGLTEGTHFKMRWASLSQKDAGLALGRGLGWKLLGSALSDLAAMGPTKNRWAMIFLGAPPSTSLRFLQDFYRGLRETAKRYDCVLAGGDTVKAREISMVAAVGAELSGSKAITRSGARPGHLLCVAGSVGDAAAGLRLLEEQQRLPPLEQKYFIRRFFDARPLFKMADVLGQPSSGVSAMMDLSDSLWESVQLLCEMSGVGARVEMTSVPVSGMYERQFGWDKSLWSGGEDYSLLFTALPAAAYKLAKGWPVQVIGYVLPKRRGVRIFHKNKPCPPPDVYRHYRSP